MQKNTCISPALMSTIGQLVGGLIERLEDTEDIASDSRGSWENSRMKTIFATGDVIQNLANAKELRHSVMNGEFEATLLKTSVITDPFQVLVAANRALHLYKIDKMTTKNVHSEVLFCLSSTKNISDSFRKYGLGDSDTSVFVVVLNDKDDSTMDLIQSKIQGTQVPLTEVKQFTDEKLVKKLYKVADTELSVGSLTDALISKIASKEFVTI